MEGQIENLFNNVNHLVECQRFVIERVNFLEEKRQEISILIQNLPISNFKETLEDQINQMELRLSINVVNDIKVQVKRRKKCRYNDGGFCKSGSNCQYYHSDIICEKFLQDGKCSLTGCKERHPKNCKFWEKNEKRCFRAESCKYLHKAKIIKNRNDNEKVINQKYSGQDEVDLEINKSKGNHGTLFEKGKDDIAITAAKDTEKDVEFKDTLDAKEAFITEREKEIAGLKAEKLQSIKLLDKYKKILYTMDQEIKILKERK